MGRSSQIQVDVSPIQSDGFPWAFMRFFGISHPILFPNGNFRSSILQVPSRGEGRRGSYSWCLQQRHLRPKRHSCWFVRRAHLKFEHLGARFAEMAGRNDPWYNLDDGNSERVDGRMDPVTGTGFHAGCSSKRVSWQLIIISPWD